MIESIMLPGIGNSDNAHWQSYWEKSDAGMRRFCPPSWDSPILTEWIAALEHEVSLCQSAPFLIAHSLSCLLVAHWASQSTQTIRGAFLVAAPNPAGAAFPDAASTFVDFPQTPLSFPTLIVASADDPYADAAFTCKIADMWNAGLILFESLGHINSASNLHEWDEGKRLYDAFKAGVRC